MVVKEQKLTRPSSTPKPLISFDQLSVGYDDTCIIQSLSGSIYAQEILAITGPNGGGKSTLLKTLMGFLVPWAGAIQLNGIKKQKIAYLPQLCQIDRTFPINVKEAVAMGAIPKTGFYEAFDSSLNQKINDALNEVGLKGFEDKPLYALSGGQFQRVLFARLILQEADLIILDEPFVSIDYHTTEDLLNLLKKWRGQGKTIICVVHNFGFIKDNFDRVLLLARQCIDWGIVDEVLTDENINEMKRLAIEFEIENSDIQQVHLKGIS